MFGKRQTIMGSLFAMFIGFMLVVLVSPLLAWQSQQQDRAKEFKKAEYVSSEEIGEGYIYTEGTIVAEEVLDCPERGDVLLVEAIAGTEEEAEGDLDEFEEGVNEEEPVVEEEETESVVNDDERERCTYVERTVEEYMLVEKEVCGEISDDQTVIEHLEDDCFLVEELEWTKTGSDAQYASFTIGTYRVAASDEAIYVDETSFVDYSRSGSEASPQEGDVRATFKYQVLADNMLVAGNPERSGEISRALEKKPFVISPRGFDGTLDDLKARDRAASTSLAVGSAIMMMLGVVLLLSPLMAITNIFSAIPFIGGHVGRGVDFVLILAGAAVGFVLWLVMFTIIVVVNNLLVAIIILGVLGLVAFYFLNQSQKQGAMQKKKAE